MFIVTVLNEYLWLYFFVSKRRYWLDLEEKYLTNYRISKINYIKPLYPKASAFYISYTEKNRSQNRENFSSRND